MCHTKRLKDLRAGENMGGKEGLMDAYAYQSEIWSKAYQIMGWLLDKKRVSKEVERWNMSDIYIYGGGYLGIQLYQAIVLYANVLSVVDKSGKLKIEIEKIPVMDTKSLHKHYKDELVIVTPIQYYKEIYQDLQEFVPKDKIAFLGDWGIV